LKAERNYTTDSLKKDQVLFVCKVCQRGFKIRSPADAMKLPLLPGMEEKEWTEEMAQTPHKYVDWTTNWVTSKGIKTFISAFKMHLKNNWNGESCAAIPSVAHHSQGIWIGDWMNGLVPKPDSPYE
jgi:hypothetical protein